MGYGVLHDYTQSNLSFQDVELFAIYGKFVLLFVERPNDKFPHENCPHLRREVCDEVAWCYNFTQIDPSIRARGLCFSILRMQCAKGFNNYL